jgi:hypothetical protein
MAQKDRYKGKPRAKPKPKVERHKEKSVLPFSRKNYVLFAIGIFVIIIGYVTLGYGSITLAPILLVLGYCVIIPIAIIINGEKERSKEPAKKEIKPAALSGGAPEVKKQ